KQKTDYEIETCLKFRRVLFRSDQVMQLHFLAGNVELSLLHQRVGKEDAHAKNRGARRNLPGDVAKTHEAQRPARNTEHRLPRRTSEERRVGKDGTPRQARARGK